MSHDKHHIDTKRESPELSAELSRNSPTSRQAGNPLLQPLYEIKDKIMGNEEYNSLTHDPNIDARSRPIQEDKFPQQPASGQSIQQSNLLGRQGSS